MNARTVIVLVAALAGGIAGAAIGYAQGKRAAMHEAESANARWVAAMDSDARMIARWHHCENEIEQLLTEEQQTQRRMRWEQFEKELEHLGRK